MTPLDLVWFVISICWLVLAAVGLWFAVVGFVWMLRRGAAADTCRSPNRPPSASPEHLPHAGSWSH